MPKEGELKLGGNVPFIQIVMKGFVGQPMAVRAEFSPEELFKSPDAAGVVMQAMKQCVRQILEQAAEADIFMFKTHIIPPRGR
jgi:hypothetical protein